uniref:Uncharacterized protein n=1 Tax=Odontella aurita TaxID=265563 RepID=A0A7S4M461_9STRA
MTAAPLPRPDSQHEGTDPERALLAESLRSGLAGAQETPLRKDGMSKPGLMERSHRRSAEGENKKCVEDCQSALMLSGGATCYQDPSTTLVSRLGYISWLGIPLGCGGSSWCPQR